MPDGHRQIGQPHRSLSAVAVVLVCIAWWGLAGHSSAAAPAQPVLKLSPDSDHYFIGSYLSYMEDPQRRLTIEDAASPPYSMRYAGHTGKMLNLGLNSSAYWIRFTIDASAVKVPPEKWLLYFDWPNRIDHATLYIPKFPKSGWLTREVGSILPGGPDPQPSTPTSFLPPHSNSAVSNINERGLRGCVPGEIVMVRHLLRHYAGYVFVQPHFANLPA
jgi:hypothetical protein